jgi:hypothetical protein
MKSAEINIIECNIELFEMLLEMQKRINIDFFKEETKLTLEIALAGNKALKNRFNQINDINDTIKNCLN